jgi:hypothetical protein
MRRVLLPLGTLVLASGMTFAQASPQTSSGAGQSTAAPAQQAPSRARSNPVTNGQAQASPDQTSNASGTANQDGRTGDANANPGSPYDPNARTDENGNMVVAHHTTAYAWAYWILGALVLLGLVRYLARGRNYGNVSEMPDRRAQSDRDDVRRVG